MKLTGKKMQLVGCWENIIVFKTVIGIIRLKPLIYGKNK